MWAMMAAPLIAGNDVRSMSLATEATLTNSDVIAVDQDPGAVQGQPIGTDLELEVWVKPLAGTATYAVALLNRTDTAADMTVAWSDIGLTSTGATVRDLWTHQDLGVVPTQYTTTVPSHGVAMLKVVGQ
jgi:alpha-galactosidase